MIEITAADGHVFTAYRADPEGTAKGVVVVLQEVFGVNSHIRRAVDALAALGFIAVAPSLFDRIQKGVALAYDEASTAQGLDLVKQVGFDHPMIDIQATVDALSAAGKVALLGFDWGGYLAYNAANRLKDVSTVVAYYGCGIVNDYGQRRRIPTLLHFGTADPYIPLDQLISFRANRPDLRVCDYPAGHHFSCDECETYDPAAAEKAWATTVLHLTHRLEGPPAVALKNQGAYASSGGKDKKKKPVTAEDDMGPPL